MRCLPGRAWVFGEFSNEEEPSDGEGACCDEAGSVAVDELGRGWFVDVDGGGCSDGAEDGDADGGTELLC